MVDAAKQRLAAAHGRPPLMPAIAPRTPPSTPDDIPMATPLVPQSAIAPQSLGKQAPWNESDDTPMAGEKTGDETETPKDDVDTQEKHIHWFNQTFDFAKEYEWYREGVSGVWQLVEVRCEWEKAVFSRKGAVPVWWLCYENKSGKYKRWARADISNSKDFYFKGGASFTNWDDNTLGFFTQWKKKTEEEKEAERNEWATNKETWKDAGWVSPSELVRNADAAQESTPRPAGEPEAGSSDGQICRKRRRTDDCPMPLSDVRGAIRSLVQWIAPGEEIRTGAGSNRSDGSMVDVQGFSSMSLNAPNPDLIDNRCSTAAD